MPRCPACVGVEPPGCPAPDSARPRRCLPWGNDSCWSSSTWRQRSGRWGRESLVSRVRAVSVPQSTTAPLDELAPLPAQTPRTCARRFYFFTSISSTNHTKKERIARRKKKQCSTGTSRTTKKEGDSDTRCQSLTISEQKTLLRYEQEPKAAERTGRAAEAILRATASIPEYEGARCFVPKCPKPKVRWIGRGRTGGRRARQIDVGVTEARSRSTAARHRKNNQGGGGKC